MTLATSGDFGRRISASFSAAAIASAAGLHQRAMEGRGHRQQHRALGAGVLGELHRPLDRRLGARDHDLAAAVVVGGLADRAGSRGRSPPRSRCSTAAPKSSPSSAAIAPSPTGTAFCIAWPRRRSSRAASSSVSDAGGAQRRIFAQRMAGDEGCVAREVEARPRPRARAAPRGCGHQRRLGVGGQRQLGLRPLEHQLARGSAPAPRRPRRTPRARRGTRRRAPCPCRPPASPDPETPRPSS